MGQYRLLALISAHRALIERPSTKKRPLIAQKALIRLFSMGAHYRPSWSIDR